MRVVQKLPEMTSASYQVQIHRPGEVFVDHSRSDYFGGVGRSANKVVFLDPDIGFEPGIRTEKHVGYSDVEAILDQLTDESVVSVFQYYRRRKFDRDFRDIRLRVMSGFAVAIYNRDVMFVSISRCTKAIESVIRANEEYARGKRLSTIADLPLGPTRSNTLGKLEKQIGVYSITQVLDALNAHKVRATYSAVADLVGTHARMLAGQCLGERRPYASWVVSKSTGMPTNYLPEHRHPDLHANSRVIETAAALADLIQSS